jgi:hypothetical protein
MLNFLMSKIPYLSALIAERDSLLKAQGIFPAGHFYSPVVSVEEARNDEKRIFDSIPASLPGIDMNESGQLEILAKFEEIYSSITIPDHASISRRYYFDNPYYSYSDGIFLHCMMRVNEPSKIIEVGSGFSSAIMLDTKDQYLQHEIEFTFIEPYPDRLKSLILEADKSSISIIEARVQDVPICTFRDLGEGDFLVIDSTHVCKTGSDVNYLLFDVLPTLRSGVLIHIHDIFYPFEYPKEWVFGGRSWNESYMIRAFLSYNSEFTIEIMNTYLQTLYPQRFFDRMPLCMNNTGGSIWLRKK